MSAPYQVLPPLTTDPGMRYAMPKRTNSVTLTPDAYAWLMRLNASRATDRTDPVGHPDGHPPVGEDIDYILPRCDQCSIYFMKQSGPGQRRWYCSNACRQRAYRARAAS